MSLTKEVQVVARDIRQQQNKHQTFTCQTCINSTSLTFYCEAKRRLVVFLGRRLNSNSFKPLLGKCLRHSKGQAGRLIPAESPRPILVPPGGPSFAWPRNKQRLFFGSNHSHDRNFLERRRNRIVTISHSESLFFWFNLNVSVAREEGSHFCGKYLYR